MRKLYQLVLLLTIFDLVNSGASKAVAEDLKTKCYPLLRPKSDQQVKICQNYGKDFNYSVQQSCNSLAKQLQRSEHSSREPKLYSKTGQSGNAGFYSPQVYGQRLRTQPNRQRIINQTNRTASTNQSSQSSKAGRITKTNTNFNKRSGIGINRTSK